MGRGGSRHAVARDRSRLGRPWPRARYCLETKVHRDRGQADLRCGQADMPEGQWRAQCNGCGRQFHRHRKPNRLRGWFVAAVVPIRRESGMGTRGERPSRRGAVAYCRKRRGPPAGGSRWPMRLRDRERGRCLTGGIRPIFALRSLRRQQAGKLWRPHSSNLSSRCGRVASL